MKRVADEMGLDRSTFLKQAIRRGSADILFDRACECYRQGKITLSRAAEMTEISLRDLILRLQSAGLELSYGVEDLRRDLGA